MIGAGGLNDWSARPEPCKQGLEGYLKRCLSFDISLFHNATLW